MSPAKTIAKKRIHNPSTGTYFSVRVRTTKAGSKGTIMKRWSSAVKKRR